MAKSHRKKTIEKLDKVVKELVKHRDNNICQKCGKYVTGTNCHASHVHPVSSGNILRWDLMNLKVLCFHCHINWWHKNPREAGEWFNKEFPERAKYLDKKKNQIVKYSTNELDDMYKAFHQIAKQVGAR